MPWSREDWYTFFFFFFFSFGPEFLAFLYINSTLPYQHENLKSINIFFILGKFMILILFKKNLFNWRLIILQYCSGFYHTLTWISHWCTCVPYPEPPSYLLPHSIPQGHSSALALISLSHSLNLDWRSISHMIIYMFQCYSLKSSHPRLLPESKSLFFTSVSLLLSCI